jgi:hypothetical protein
MNNYGCEMEDEVNIVPTAPARAVHALNRFMYVVLFLILPLNSGAS